MVSLLCLPARIVFQRKWVLRGGPTAVSQHSEVIPLDVQEGQNNVLPPILEQEFEVSLEPILV